MCSNYLRNVRPECHPTRDLLVRPVLACFRPSRGGASLSMRVERALKSAGLWCILVCFCMIALVLLPVQWSLDRSSELLAKTRK